MLYLNTLSHDFFFFQKFAFIFLIPQNWDKENKPQPPCKIFAPLTKQKMSLKMSYLV